MKAKALQFGKAISAALFVLLLVVVGSKNALAQTQVATLQHGDDVSVFYGIHAFVQAHTAAQTGDIITLSSGTFVPTTITKAITLRGAGCAVDTMANIIPTIFDEEITLNVADTANFLTIEGILFMGEVTHRTLYNPKFYRCNFSDFNSGTFINKMHNAQFVNCIINSFDFYNALNTILINSVVWSPRYINNDSPVELYNSIMKVSGFSALSAYNSIIVRETSNKPDFNCSFINCIGINTYNSQSPFGSGYTVGCTTYATYSEVFESFTGEFSLDESFVLKDEIATSILGNDGSQVGIHGGIMPYSNIPSYMLRTNVSVPNHSNIDGTLNVEIEVIDDDQ